MFAFSAHLHNIEYQSHTWPDGELTLHRKLAIAYVSSKHTLALSTCIQACAHVGPGLAFSNMDMTACTCMLPFAILERCLPMRPSRFMPRTPACFLCIARVYLKCGVVTKLQCNCFTRRAAASDSAKCGSIRRFLSAFFLGFTRASSASTTVAFMNFSGKMRAMAFSSW